MDKDQLLQVIESLVWSHKFRSWQDNLLTSEKLCVTVSSTATEPSICNIFPKAKMKNCWIHPRAVSIHLCLINTESIYCTGDSYFVNLIHSAVSTLFNLPCNHSPLRFHSGDYNSRHFSGCGWLQRARNGTDAAHFYLQQQIPSPGGQLAMFFVETASSAV